MDIYTKKSRWKIYLAIAGVIIILISMFYTNYLVKKLKAEEVKKANLVSSAISSAGKMPLDYDLNLHYEVIGSNETIPIVIEDEKGKLTGHLYDEALLEDQEFLKGEKEKIIETGGNIIEGVGYAKYIYFKNSNLIRLLSYLPYIQFLLISAFIAAGYFSFSTARRSEQNQVWAGMAKETAHQLGTPISAIIAWIEHLKIEAEGNPDQMEIIGELRNDVTRLELIADRFSKIGSEPVLEKINIYDELEKCRVYMERRASRKVKFNFPNPTTNPIFVNINPPLFDWVIENLLRNSLDAMDGSGDITVFVEEEGNEVSINLSDTGKGIPANKFKTVFEPGFTTKKRGWGLGLSLAKRIIDNYHKGKIFVKNSKLDGGTTFCIKLPTS
jgi:signal transduction histidine kinase